MAGLSESNLLDYISRNIDDIFFHGTEIQEFLKILHNYTLPEFSVYYPTYVPDVLVKKEYAIPELMDTTSGQRKKVYRKYQIPKPNNIEYVSISSWSGSGSEIRSIPYGPSGYIGNTVSAQMINQLYLPKHDYIISFEPPNFAIVSPTTLSPISFVLKMKRVCFLNEILLAYHSMFKKLYLGDIKNYLYNRYRRLANGGVYNGMEITLDMSVYEDGKDMRAEVIEQMEEDWHKDPRIFEELLSGL